MPWGTLDVSGVPEAALVRARKAWTGAAFQEHRTGVACCAALRALFECRAPVDLTALAARFPMDELVHVELCSRMAMELGGGTEIRYEPEDVIADAASDLPPLMRAADMIVRFFCVGEAVSIPLLRGTWHAARHPLPRAVLASCVTRPRTGPLASRSSTGPCLDSRRSRSRAWAQPPTSLSALSDGSGGGCRSRATTRTPRRSATRLPGCAPTRTLRSRLAPSRNASESRSWRAGFRSQAEVLDSNWAASAMGKAHAEPTSRLQGQRLVLRSRYEFALGRS
jgi:hypothetical protein